MGLVVRDDGWRMPDWLWAELEPSLPERPAHPLGCHNPRVPDRDAMDAILFVLGPLSVERVQRDRDLLLEFGPSVLPGMGRAGVFAELWRRGLPPTTSRKGSSGSGWRWTAR